MIFITPEMSLGNKIQSIINDPIFIETFLTHFEGCFAEVEQIRPIRIAVKSYRQTENGLDIEFYNIDDASLFWNNQDKEIELIFNPE